MTSNIFVNADGGSRGNPGPAAIGIVVRNGSEVLQSYKEYIGSQTNNVAEYHALIKALQLAAQHTHGEITVIMDSELVVKQLLGEYTVKAGHLKPLFLEVKEIEKIFSNVEYTNVSREDSFQSMADALVNEALDEHLGKR